MSYYLDCQVCGYETHVEKDVESVLDEIEDHHDDYDATHFVEFELVEEADRA